VMFVHDNSTKITGLAGEGDSPVVWVSCEATLQDIMVGSGRGVFAPNATSKNLPCAKYYLPGLCITLRRDHYFPTVKGAHHIKPAGAYQALFHWHEGACRLALDPVSRRTTDTSSRRSVSHPFAYHGLSYLLQSVFQA
jgi:hypothetical protein